ncbi:RNA polymerase subunit AC19 [Cystobasidiomycetes sp. EMM_F5]
MHDGKSAVDAVHKGIDALEVIFRTIDEKYKADVAEGDYDTTETKPLTLDDVRAMKTRPQAEKQEDATMS